MAIDYKIIGQRIKAQRLIKGTTQEHFAEQMDVSVGYISQLERGITKISLERLSIVADYLECDMGLLLEGTSSLSKDYLDPEFKRIFTRLSSYEKEMLTLMTKTYIDNRKSK
jgi:transcriptional regulator with XRE-family HTH domain